MKDINRHQKVEFCIFLTIPFILFSIFFLPASVYAVDICTVRIVDINIEKVDSVNPEYFCPGDRYRVSAEIYVSGAGASVDTRLYIDGDYYDSETLYVSSGSTRKIIFDRIIETDDCNICGSCDFDDYEIRVVADAYCGYDEETTSIYFDNWCWDYYSCGGYWSSDYGKLKVRVVDCKTDNFVQDATVEVRRGSYNVKTTHYGGYATFTLLSGIYDITASKSGYSSEMKEVRVYAGRTRSVEICLGKDCTEEFTSEFRCLGPYSQRKYIYSDCTEQWRAIEYCSDGCVDGICLPPQTTTTTVPAGIPTSFIIKPLFALEPVYEIEACKVSSFPFNVINLGPKREFKFTVEGPGKELVYVPSSATLDTGENEVVAYVYMCDPGRYDFSVKAQSDSMTSTSHSVLSVYSSRPLISFLDALVLSLIVIVVILIVLKMFLPKAFGRVRSVEKAEGFCSKDI